MESGISNTVANGAALSRVSGEAIVVPSPEYNQVALGLIHESPSNPRKTFDQAKLEELAKSIAAIGLLQPIVVRVSPWEKNQYEVVAGARRYRAAKLARLDLIEVRIVVMTDIEVLEAQLVENDQREDVRELEQAEGYRALMTAAKLSTNDIAEKLNRSREFVYGRLKLLDGTEEVRKALSEGRGGFTAGHAILISRLSPAEQKEALKACFPSWQDGRCNSVRELDQWLDQHMRLDLNKASFQLHDKNLVPAAGACEECPKREKQRCQDRACYETKVRAQIDRRKAELTGKGTHFVQVSENYSTPRVKGAHSHNDWQEVPAGEKGPRIFSALVVEGSRAGKLITVKLAEPKPAEGKSKERRVKDQARIEAKAKQEGAVRLAILDAVLEKVSSPPDREILDAIAGELYDSASDSDGGAELEQRHPELTVTRKAGGWKEAKLERVKLIAALKPQALTRLLVEALVIDDCGSEPYTLNHKPERLLSLAKRYKVNTEKIRVHVLAELAKGPAEKKLEELGLLPKATHAGAAAHVSELCKRAAKQKPAVHTAAKAAAK